MNFDDYLNMNPFWKIFMWLYKKATIPVVGPIAMLGMKESGKTTFLRWLQEDKFVQVERRTTIDGENYDEFSVKYGDQEYVVKAGKDISGNVDVKDNYEDMIEKSNSVMFFFNANTFIKDKQYRNDVFNKVYFVAKKYKEYNTKGKKIIALVATHIDEYNGGLAWTTMYNFANTAKNVHEEIVRLANEENPEIADCFDKNMTTCDLRKKESFETLLKRLFTK